MRGVSLVDALIGFESGDLHVDRPGLGRALAMHVAMWTAMIAATMLPLIRVNVRYVALRCPGRLRRLAMMDIVAGWAVAWVAAAIIIATAAWLMLGAAGPTGAVALAFGAATVWQLTARKQISVARCHRTMAPALGRRAARVACRRFGFALGGSCVLSCWALMMPMALLDHHLLVVGPLTAVSWYERTRPHRQLRPGVTAAAVAGIGLASVTPLVAA
jgi:predicted metal-binding membrane protein